MLRKKLGFEVIDDEMVAIQDTKWKKKCFYCKAHFPQSPGTNYWKCWSGMHDICLEYKRCVPLKFLKKPRYALQKKNTDRT